ncbi:hypothetical protein ASE25_05505 [Terrabacter sp. Root85]|nr:hypothetical protein ASE25_05505 [Terrabacter sp. Root85]
MREVIDPELMDELEAELAAKRATDHATLKTELLSANKEIYSTCDRYESEAAFRLSLLLPLLILALSAASKFPLWMAILIVACACVLGLRGLSLAISARSLVRQACLSGLLAHPLTALESRVSTLKATHPAPTLEGGTK